MLRNGGKKEHANEKEAGQNKPATPHERWTKLKVRPTP
jgi:hypothetical protein